MDVSINPGARVALQTLLVNVLLAAVKVAAGVAGRSYALIADGFESLVDMFTTLVVWGGLKVGERPPDGNHPYGHGKAESLAGLAVGLSLMVAAALLSLNAMKFILEPAEMPAAWTLPVLVLVIATKELLYRRMKAAGKKLHSTALESDAQHQRSDAITSVAALIGISLARFGGPVFAGADAWAALFACAIIGYNAVNVLRKSFGEMMDASAPEETLRQVRELAMENPAVRGIHKCRVRKSGTGLWMDIQVLVDGDLTVREGHDIAHVVSDKLKESDLPIRDVVVHVEPEDRHPELVG